MNIFVIGCGRVGTALSNFLRSRNIDFSVCEKIPENRCGILFLAVSDSAVKTLLDEVKIKSPKLFAVHFSAGTHYESERCFLLHPFCSVSPESDLSKILFTLWGKKDPDFEKMLSEMGFDFVYCGASPDLLYHSSAVMSGNFTQYFALSALELLSGSGFAKEDAERLVRQLVNSSLDNVFAKGKEGITGPAARGENEVISNEINVLSEKDKNLAILFKAVNDAIIKLLCK